MRYIENVNTLYLAKILNYIVYYKIAIYINFILHDICFPKNMGVMHRATRRIHKQVDSMQRDCHGAVASVLGKVRYLN